MINKYSFGKYREIKILWLFIVLFSISISVSIYLMPIPNLVKIFAFSVVGLFALLQVLLFHEVFIIMKGEEWLTNLLYGCFWL